MFFRKKPAEPQETTFKERVEEFWSRFAPVAPGIRQSILDRTSAGLDEKTTPLVKSLSPTLAWVYGPGNTPENRSLTVSAEGDRHHRQLTEYWLKRAPVLEGWDFFAARQPGNIDHATINIRGVSYTPLQFWMTPEVDEENEVIHLVAWCPGFKDLEERDRWQILFLWLDEALGEDRVGSRLGRIEIRDNALAESFPLLELHSFVEQTEQRLGWKPAGTSQLASFRFKEALGDFPRGDMLIGHTTQAILWQEYLEADGKYDDPLENSGAAYYFLQFPSDCLPTGEEANERFRLEEHFTVLLEASSDGLCLGGGISPRLSYIDFLLFDGARSIARVMEILREDGVVKKATLHRFAGNPAQVLASL